MTHPSTQTRLAVVGGGMAGFMAAAHLSHCLPRAELLHVHDSRRPPIGIGLSSNPTFSSWCEQLGDLPFSRLEAECDATLKLGSRFEGWGSRQAAFDHSFQPTGTVAYHVDASKFIALLAERVRAVSVDAEVADIEHTDAGADIIFDDGHRQSCSFVIDARGYPSPTLSDVLSLAWIPSNAALVTNCGTLPPGRGTGIFARPHGWVSLIPLRGRTSLFYVYNAEMSPAAEVGADLDLFLREQGLERADKQLQFRFPNFVRRTFLDGAVFRVGNSASFIEPLEALGIGNIVFQLRAAQRWIADSPSPEAEASERAALNHSMLMYSLRNSLFISWHYSAGSCFSTPFWNHAMLGYSRAAEHPDLRAHVATFNQFLTVAHDFPVARLAAVQSPQQWKRDIFPLLRLYRPFGCFSELNVAQVGHGLGCFAHD